MNDHGPKLVLVIAGLLVSSCATEDRREQPVMTTPDERFEALASAPPQSCDAVTPLRLDTVSVFSSRGEHACLAGALTARQQRLTTLCEGSQCFCLLDDEPYCSCQTDGQWCDEPIESCCPIPFP